MTKRLAPEVIMQQISNLSLQFPELKNDEDGWLMSVESETDVHEFLHQIESKRSDAVAMDAALTSQIDNLMHRRERFRQRDEALRALALEIMQRADIQKLELDIATLSVRAVPPKVMILHEDQLPDEAFRIKREPDKTKIKELLLAGPVAGATLSNGGTTISIRTR